MSPMGQGHPKGPFQTKGRGQVVKGTYQPTSMGASPWEENTVSL
jgi:hypothetical protein